MSWASTECQHAPQQEPSKGCLDGTPFQPSERPRHGASHHRPVSPHPYRHASSSRTVVSSATSRKRATNPGPSRSFLAPRLLCGERAQHEILQKPPKLGLCASLGPLAAPRRLWRKHMGQADCCGGSTLGRAGHGGPCPHPGHNGQDCFLVISPLW